MTSRPATDFPVALSIRRPWMTTPLGRSSVTGMGLRPSASETLIVLGRYGCPAPAVARIRYDADLGRPSIRNRPSGPVVAEDCASLPGTDPQTSTAASGRPVALARTRPSIGLDGTAT